MDRTIRRFRLRGEAFDLLKAKFKDDANAMTAVSHETQFKDALEKR